MGSEVGPGSVFALSFGTIVGILWVFLLATWIEAAGPVGTAVGIVTGALAMLPIALCYTRMLGRFPGGGGEIRYGLACFGGGGAFLAAWLLFMAYTVLASFCLPLFQWLAEVTLSSAGWPAQAPSAAAVVTWATFAAIVVANYRGIETAAWLQNVIVVLLIGLTAALGITAAVVGQGHNLEPLFGAAARGPGPGLASVVATAPFLFAGFNTALQALGGAADRRMAHALLASVVAASIFYAGVVVAIPATLPRAELLALDLPALQAVGRALHARAAVVIMGCMAGLALLSSWNALVFAASRVFRLLARSGAIPALSGKALGPASYVGTIALSAGILSFAGRTALGTMVSFVSLCMTLVFLVVAAGLWRLERADPNGRRALPSAAVTVALVLAGLGLRELPASAASSPTGAIVVAAWLAIGAGLGAALLRRRNAAARFEAALESRQG